jgi:hypothetical protein
MYNSQVKKKYFGIAALITGILCVLSRLAQIRISYLNITPETFGQLNNLTALVYCLLTPSTLVLAVMGFMRKNDSKVLSLIAIVLVFIPFVIATVQMVGAIQIK